MELVQTQPLWKRNLKRFISNKLASIGLVIFLTIILMIIFAPLFTSYNPNEVNYAAFSQPPSRDHIFGTDKLGRDVFSRILYGGRVSVAVGVIGATMGAVLGSVLGAVSGYFGGKLDSFIVKISEIFLIFPQLILILVVSSIVGRGVINLIFVFSFTGWMTTFRQVRNKFMSLKEETYVEASKAFGYGDYRIMFSDLLPNSLSPVFISLSINAAGNVLGEAGLSFLGFGVPTDIPTWGNIMNAAQSMDVIQNNWWLWMIPGITISIFTLSINFIGDGLRDALDPRQT